MTSRVLDIVLPTDEAVAANRLRLPSGAGGGRRAGALPEIGFAIWPFFDERVEFEAMLADMIALASGQPIMARVQVSWADWARPRDGPRWLDYLINRLHDAGVEIFPTFMWTPPSFGLAPISSAPPRDLGTFVCLLHTCWNATVI